jgi:hypothetical protein
MKPAPVTDGEPTGSSVFPAAATSIELSVVMPCLNEADTLGTRIEKARGALQENASAGEMTVADDGSRGG